MAKLGKIPELENNVTGKETVIDEGESFEVYGTFKDGDNNAILESNISAFTVTLFDEETETIINSRNETDVLDANIGVVDLAGTFTLRFTGSDSPIVSSSLSVSDVESHIVRLKWTWNDGVSDRNGISEHRIYVRKIASPS